jgi:hypothetical protein
MPQEGIDSPVVNNNGRQQNFRRPPDAGAHRAHAATYLGTCFKHSQAKALHEFVPSCRHGIKSGYKLALVVLERMVEIEKTEQFHDTAVLVVPTQGNRRHAVDETVDETMITAADGC